LSFETLSLQGGGMKPKSTVMNSVWIFL